MADGLLYVMSLSMVVGVSSFLVGLIPMTLNVSPRKMRLITICGTGILVGTALIVVIPEGVETLYSARPVAHHQPRSMTTTSIVAPGVSARRKPFNPQNQGLPMVHARENSDHNDYDQIPAEGDLLGLSVLKANEKPAIEADDALTTPSNPRDNELRVHDDDFEPHAWIGLSIIAGFVLMYLIDRLPRVASASTARRPSYVFLERLGLDSASGRTNSAAAGGEDVSGTTHAHLGSGSRHAPTNPMPLTTGLVIHAAADGIALGASSTAQSPTSLPFIIFIALVLHKAPAAFGLTAVLLRRNVSRRRIKGYLLVFSLAAPVGTLASWAAASSVSGGGYLSGGSESATGFATGVLLLFSGGTFLYVAMHAMQDAGSSDEDEGFGSDDVYGSSQQRPHTESMVDVMTMLGGMLLPLLTQLGHHGHG